MKTFNQWFNQQLRQVKPVIAPGATQGPLAKRQVQERTGMAYTSIMALTKPTANPSIVTADRICGAFNIALSDVVEKLETDDSKILRATVKPPVIFHLDILKHDTQAPDAVRFLFAEWVRSAMRSYNLKGPQISKAAGLSQFYVAGIVNPKRTMCASLYSAERITNALNLPLSSVLKQLEAIQDVVWEGGTEAGKKYLTAHAVKTLPLLRDFTRARQGG